MILQLVAEVVPVVPINKGVSAATTGILLLDVLPLLTMLPAVSTLRLHARARRWNDLLAFGIGFALAVIYHVVHMMPGGIAEASLWGVSGATWRTLDILWAQGILARTFGHVVGVHRPSIATFANLAFPAGVLVMSKTFEVFTLGIASKILSIVVFLTLVAKLSLEGRESMPQYDATRGRAALVCFALGLMCFPLPELVPEMYWLFHSLWHIFMAAGIFEVYLELSSVEGLKKPIWLPAHMVKIS